MGSLYQIKKAFFLYETISDEIHSLPYSEGLDYLKKSNSNLDIILNILIEVQDSVLCL